MLTFTYPVAIERATIRASSHVSSLSVVIGAEGGDVDIWTEAVGLTPERALMALEKLWRVNPGAAEHSVGGYFSR